MRRICWSFSSVLFEHDSLKGLTGRPRGPQSSGSFYFCRHPRRKKGRHFLLINHTREISQKGGIPSWCACHIQKKIFKTLSHPSGIKTAVSPTIHLCRWIGNFILILIHQTTSPSKNIKNHILKRRNLFFFCGLERIHLCLTEESVQEKEAVSISPSTAISWGLKNTVPTWKCTSWFGQAVGEIRLTETNKQGPQGVGPTCIISTVIQAKLVQLAIEFPQTQLLFYIKITISLMQLGREKKKRSFRKDLIKGRPARNFLLPCWLPLRAGANKIPTFPRFRDDISILRPRLVNWGVMDIRSNRSKLPVSRSSLECFNV